jgi:hypothetical protein
MPLYKVSRMRMFAKIKVVILQPAKNLIFFFSSQKIKRRDPLALQPQDDKKVNL